MLQLIQVLLPTHILDRINYEPFSFISWYKVHPRAFPSL